ncbi:hypothetical protein VIGAN_09092600 [Vigna angularis var. angularis]|uniref:Uncharacterized protein n=1 Tax=Vigna angularis var. angularis TaxID=157739 RepID=A0A0S3SXD9_PHAAN|nr:hypothetical protein VIGAN_09092600 [Vigna angularis var. angularis]
MANISNTMSKGVIDDENYCFLNSIGKGVWDVVTNNPHEQIKTRIEKVKIKDFSRSRRLNQEEKGYTNTLKSAAEIGTIYGENSENEETNLMAKRLSKFLMYKRKANLNFAGNKGNSRKVLHTAVPPYRPKTDFERYIVKQMQTLVNHHSAYTSRLDKLDQEIVAL